LARNDAITVAFYPIFVPWKYIPQKLSTWHWRCKMCHVLFTLRQSHDNNLKPIIKEVELLISTILVYTSNASNTHPHFPHSSSNTCWCNHMQYRQRKSYKFSPSFKYFLAKDDVTGITFRRQYWKRRSTFFRNVGTHYGSVYSRTRPDCNPQSLPVVYVVTHTTVQMLTWNPEAEAFYI
jgi:hypothetical protein